MWLIPFFIRNQLHRLFRGGDPRVCRWSWDGLALEQLRVWQRGSLTSLGTRESVSSASGHEPRWRRRFDGDPFGVDRPAPSTPVRKPLVARWDMGVGD